MVCKCNIIEIDGEHLIRNLGKAWDLGPVLIAQDSGSNYFSIIGTHETFENSFITLKDFKSVIMLEGIEKPFTVKFSVTGDRGIYGMDPVHFSEQVVCRYKKTVYDGEKVVLVLEMLAKGKELNIFYGTDGNNGESTGDKKHLFWASILKGNIH